MEGAMHVKTFLIIIFVVGYLAIIFERFTKVNKTAAALIMAAFSWGVLFSSKGKAFLNADIIDSHLGHASQIIFFLLGAVTLVELIDSHNGFKIITDFIKTRSKKKMLWLLGFFAFFLSAILDNLTTTIVLISVLRKIIPEKNERMFLGAGVVIAANAGGAWTPIGDVTTTMLWIKGNLTTLSIVKTLFLPSLVSMVVSFFLLSLNLKGKYPVITHKTKGKGVEPGARLVFSLGVLSLAFVPVIRSFTGLPPFMSIFIGLGIMWVITDIMHYKYEERKHLRIPHVLTKIDSAGILFFLGILLSISALEIVGVLQYLAKILDTYLANSAVIATVIGILSSIIDNVPLVAASIGMYSLNVFPVDSTFWQMIAYAAGTGGSILIIGSAAGVAMMGLEKVDFIWYFKKISFTALAGYVAGMAFYLIVNIF